MKYIGKVARLLETISEFKAVYSQERLPAPTFFISTDYWEAFAEFIREDRQSVRPITEWEKTGVVTFAGCTVIHVEQLAPMTIVHGSNVLNLMWKKVDIPEKAEAVWITDEEGFVTCSNCGEVHTWDDFRPPFCDMCGKRMRDGREDIRNEQS